MKKKLLCALLVLCLVFSACATLIACDKDSTYEGNFVELDDYKQYVLADLKYVKDGIPAINTDIDAAITAAYDSGVSAINAATSVAIAQQALNSAKTAIANCIPLADGVFDFTALSTADKTNLLGVMEKFAINSGLTGMTFFEDGGKVMYNPRITLGTENYIAGYGFGILKEGSIKTPLAATNEPNEAWRNYYHVANSTDPGTANYLNDKGSEVSDFYDYISASYFTVFMNSNKDGYEWKTELAKSDVVPVNLNAKTNQATKWKFQIRTGADGLKYSTLSTIASRAAFNDREVQAEDYITAFKLLLNQANGYARGTELANATGPSKIVGASTYYRATKNAAKGIPAEEDFSFDAVGIKVSQDEDQNWWLEYELGSPVTEFYARYYISSSLYMPIPADFINLVGVDNYLSFNEAKTETPADNGLSLGAYTLETWNSDQEVVYKKNPNYVYADTKYSIEGVHINILPGMKDDQELAFREFLAGNLDGAGIPSTQLEEYENDERTRQALGSSCFKLNVNALNSTDWETLFGENGSVAQNKPADYWQVEPALSNEHFRLGLNYAINRKEFAEMKGAIASVDFFSSNYLSDPVNGISYSSTDAHKAALSRLVTEDTDEYGYSLELAREYFKLAIEELEASGAYKRGTVKHPTVITLEVAWMYQVHEEAYHKYLKQFWETAFNDESVSHGVYKLDVKFWVGSQWSDVYYSKMLVGQFDVGFGSISGNELDPLSFFNVLSSDMNISNGFTLNWGLDTNNPTGGMLLYNGMRWSFDALYRASQQVTMVKNGALVSAADITDANVEDNEDDATVTVTIEITLGSAQVTIDNIDFVLYGYDATQDSIEFSVTDVLVSKKQEIKDGVLTVTIVIPYEEYNKIAFYPGLDLYIDYTINYEVDNEPQTGSSTYVYIGGFDF